MAAKKKPAKAAKRPTPVRKAPAKPTPKAARPAGKKSAKPAKKQAPPTKRAAAAPKKPDRARLMAAFSQQIAQEEEAPVAVRTFNEARAGIEKSKVLDVKTGAVKPVQAAASPKKVAAPRPAAQPTQDDSIDDQGAQDLEEMEADEAPPVRPKVEPLTGQLAVPKRQNPLDEELRVAEPPKKGKKGQLPTKEDLGKIELRMQRGSKDEPIAHANPDYLQRSFNQAAQKGKVAATGSARAADETKQDEFEVEMDKRTPKLDARLTDFGDIEIAQQTRQGRKKVGKLDVDDEEKA